MKKEKALHNNVTNSDILVQDFDYYEPVTVDEALIHYKKAGDGARFMAGGTNLLVSMKMENESPRAIISLNKIPELCGIQENNDEVVIGARTTIYDVAQHPLILSKFYALAEACASFGSTQIQMMGTIGGNICNGSPASDSTPALLSCDASFELVSLSGSRAIPASEFFLSPGKTAIHDGEILARIHLPTPQEGVTSRFIKISRVAADLAKASLAISVHMNGETIQDCRIALGSVAPVPLRAKKAEALLKGNKLSKELAEKAAKMVSEEVSPIDDIRSSGWYRRQVCAVMLQDALGLIFSKEPSKSAPISAHKLVENKMTSGKPVSLSHNESKEIDFIVNNRPYSVKVKANDLLLNVIRNKTDLTGVKYGCGVGECAACTIHVDGVPVLSCLTLAASVEGKRITTIEGLQKEDGSLDRLQASFIKNTGFQCGYCTPGIIMTAKYLTDEVPQPSEEEVRDFLKGNRCRCTGYASIVRSILDSVAQ